MTPNYGKSATAKANTATRKAAKTTGKPALTGRALAATKVTNPTAKAAVTKTKGK